MSAALYIAAKAPRPGFVKTRLARSIGDHHAVALYRAFLRDLAARFGSAPFPVGWYVTPPEAWLEIGPDVDWTQPVRIVAQGDGDWAERQSALFRDASARAEERVVLIGSDSPHVTVGVIAEALRRLERHDLVLGPTLDGGYYLIGMRGWRDVLRDIQMSTRTVREELLVRASKLGLAVSLVEATFDVDDAADLRHLREIVATRADLPATRAALASLAAAEYHLDATPAL